MKKSYKTKIRGLSKKQLDRLKELSNSAKNLYNQALYILKNEYKTTQKHLSYYEMDKIMKQTLNLESEINYKKLKAGVSQQILKKLDINFSSFFKAIKSYSKDKSKFKGCPKPPKFIKDNYYNLIYDNIRFQVKNDFIVLEKALKDENGEILVDKLEIKIPKYLIGKKINQIEIIPKYGYFEAIFVYEDTKNYKQIAKNKNVVGIDLGLNNLATVVSNGIFKPFIINGKPLKSINQFYNKIMAKLKSRLDKGEQKWSKRLQKLTDNRNNKMKDYLHKSSQKIVEECINNDISTVVIGNVANSNNKINLGKRNNQNFVNISLGQFVEKLKYKLEAHNIDVKVVEESYTSKASFIDNDKLPKKLDIAKKFKFSGVRVKRGLYKPLNAIFKKVNADCNGAYNIIRKVVPNFSFEELSKKVNDGIAGWFLPHIKIIDMSIKVNVN